MGKVLSLLAKTKLLPKIWFAFPEGKIKEQIREAAIALAKSAPLELIVRRGDTVCLVGAPPGGEYLQMAKLVGEKGLVIAVEPEKGNLEKLKREVREKGLRNVTIVPKAAHNEKGEQTLLVSDHPADHKIEVQGVVHDNDLRPGAYQFMQKIETDTLDNILKEVGIDHVDFVKITVNGAELEVLKGMEATLKTDLRLWVKGHAKKNGQPINREITKMLRDKGFTTRIVGGGEASISKDFVRAGDVYARRLG